MAGFTDVSSLKKNIAYNFVYQLLILVLPLVTAPYLSRVIGAEGVGTYSYSYAIATYFTYFVKLGLDNYGNRTIAACQADHDVRTRTFWSIYAQQACCFIVVGVCYLGYCFLIADNLVVALLQGLFVLSSLFDVNWFFFGMEQFRLTVIRNTVVKVGCAALVFLLVRDADDVDLYIAIMCGGFLISQLALWPLLRRFVGLYRPRLREVCAHLRPNLVLFVSVIAISLYNTLSTIMLGAMAGEEEVGFFDNAAKIVSVPTALVGAVGTVMLPRTSSLLAQGREVEASVHVDRTMLAVMAFSGVAVFGIPSVACPFVRIYYGAGFEASAASLIVLCAKVPLLAFGNVMRTQYLIPRKLDNVFLVSAFCGAAVSVAVNLVLVPSFGSLGAAFASVAAEFAVLAYQAFRVRGNFPLGRFSLYGAVFVCIGALMALVLRLIPYMGSDLVDVATRVGIGSTVYLSLAALAVRLLSRGERFVR